MITFYRFGFSSIDDRLQMITSGNLPDKSILLIDEDSKKK
jgi:hypothetical protein